MENTNFERPAFVGVIEQNIEIVHRAEKIAFVVFLFGISGHLLSLPVSNILLLAGALTLAVVHFALSFYSKELYEVSDQWEAENELGTFAFTNFIYKIFFISLTLIDSSMIYLVIGAPISYVLPVIGGMSLLAALVLTGFAKMKHRAQFYGKLYYIRSGLGLFFILFLVFHLVLYF